MKIGKYEILEELGRGSMGIVYRARDPLLDRQVAIKLVSTENVDELTLPLFEREAKVIARMSHPNIVVVHDYEYFNDEPYIVMELLKGQDLQSMASENPLTLTQSLDIIRQTLSGLHHAHEHGVIHRDIKPTNIFVTESNVTKILDFGVARLAASSTVTDGFVLGTPEYMSPEQVKAESLDGRSDLFSLGSVLYWLFMGKTPFDADTAEATMVRIVKEDPSPMEIPEVSPLAYSGLMSVLNRALAKNPADRFSTAAGMAKEIEDLIHIVEQESELQSNDSELEYMETLQVQKPKFATTKKAATSDSVQNAPDESIKMPSSSPEEVLQPSEPSNAEPEPIEKTMQLRSLPPRPKAVPRAVNPETTGASEPPVSTESAAPVETAGAGKLKTGPILVALIVVIAIASVLILRQCA